ncbi:hypothetical protein [Streptomyces sp. DW26H14]|uniref:hypothetical protein n=1 Tax=Streptomyces sp. DW26H14 TaxID=3435395 RepID=UPI00403DC823
MRKAVAAGIGSIALMVGGLITAAPAQASTYDCTSYLGGLDYSVGAKLTAACVEGANGTIWGKAACAVDMYNLIDDKDVATTACHQAAR